MKRISKTKYGIWARFFAATFLILLASSPSLLSAQSSVLDECDLTTDPLPKAIRKIAIDYSWRGVNIDGGGGNDIIRQSKPSFFLPRPEKFSSLEVINLRNGLFDTVVVNGEMILTTELGELEVITDWFDQIILDPFLTWNRSVDTAFSSQIFRSSDFGRDVTVRTALDANIVQQPQLLLQAQEGPLGKFAIYHPAALPQTKRTAGSSAVPSSLDLRWTDAGLIEPDIGAPGDALDTVSFDTRNGVVNAVLIDAEKLAGSAARHITFEGDPYDRLILLQHPCWQPSKDDNGDKATTSFNKGQPSELILTTERNFLNNRRIQPFKLGVAAVPGYRHLSADSNSTLDAIDLRNGGRDILIIRNDLRIRRDFPVIIEGDEGLDEIWLEGAAGWQAEFQDFGVVATVPSGGGANLILAFAPGMKFGVLPFPEFLRDPKMLSLAAYPGTRDATSKHTGLTFSRGGFVKLSVAQSTNRSLIDLRNGAGNVFLLSPDILVDAADELTITGDLGRDVILSDHMPEATAGPSGTLVWRIERPDRPTQIVTAVDISYISFPNPK